MAYKFTKEEYPYYVEISSYTSVDNECHTPREAALDFIDFLKAVIFDYPYLYVIVKDRITGRKYNISVLDESEDEEIV